MKADGEETKQIPGGERGREWSLTLVYVTMAMRLLISLKEPDEVGAKVEKDTRHMHSDLKFRRAV